MSLRACVRVCLLFCSVMFCSMSDMITVHSATDSTSTSTSDDSRGSDRGSVSWRTRGPAARCGSWTFVWNDTMLASLFEYTEYLRKEKNREEKISN